MKLLIVLLGGIVVGYIIKDLLEKMLKKRNKVEKNKQETAPLVEKTIGIERLWSDGTEKQWQDALSHYGDLLRTDAKALEEVLGRIGAQGVGAMSAEEFYDFLYHKYYVWKYTQKIVWQQREKLYDGMWKRMIWQHWVVSIRKCSVRTKETFKVA